MWILQGTDDKMFDILAHTNIFPGIRNIGVIFKFRATGGITTLMC
jgi:hypothetical protein